MALTLVAEQRLTKAGLVDLFDQNQAAYTAAAKSTADFIKGNFPAGATIRPDDVSKALYPVIEVNELLKTTLSAKKLTEKYWVQFFTDLIIDRVWDQIKP
jgi:hypothetical protein